LETLLAFLLMLPSTLLIPRLFMDFMAELEARATAGDSRGGGIGGLLGTGGEMMPRVIAVFGN
jgi:hypothetical protein